PAHLLGNLQELPLVDMVSSEQQRAFGQAKADTLPQYCLDCEVRFVCNGGCPKDRVLTTPDGEAGLNVLCAGYRAFFNHIDPYMRFMAGEIRQRRPPANVMRWVRQNDLRLKETLARSGRNERCPCGSGKKVKRCCGSSRLPIGS
nr:SPASM domain-containing protein [Deinococcota bacterium]